MERMKESVEGPSSNVALTLSGPTEFRDILEAFKIAYQEIKNTENIDIIVGKHEST